MKITFKVHCIRCNTLNTAYANINDRSVSFKCKNKECGYLNEGPFNSSSTFGELLYMVHRHNAYQRDECRA